MDTRVSAASEESSLRHLGQREVLLATVEQLQKDLGAGAHGFDLPEVGPRAFEDLRGQVLPVLEQLAGTGGNALMVVLYRVHIPESHYRSAMALGGLHHLAGEVVLRTLQKVLTRLRFAGRY